MINSISSNSSSSASSAAACLSKQRAANINQSFQKHFQNLSAHDGFQSQREALGPIDLPNSNCSSSNSLTSLDRRLCKTLPRKLTKGIVGKGKPQIENLKMGAIDIGTKIEADNKTHKNTSPAESSNSGNFDKRKSDPYLDISTKENDTAINRAKGPEMARNSAQRHSFGGLVAHRVVPPPAKYKGVHFAPNVEVSKRDKTPSPEESDKAPDIPIPTEGLPTRPARAPPTVTQGTRGIVIPSNNGSTIIIPKTSETVPIVVKDVSDRPPSDKIVSSVTNSNCLGIEDSLAIARRSSSLTFNKGPVKPNGT